MDRVVPHDPDRGVVVHSLSVHRRCDRRLLPAAADLATGDKEWPAAFITTGAAAGAGAGLRLHDWLPDGAWLPARRNDPDLPAVAEMAEGHRPGNRRVLRRVPVGSAVQQPEL